MNSGSKSCHCTCHTFSSHETTAAAALGPHSSHISYDASGSISSKHGAPFSETLWYLQPSTRGPQLSALKGQQVDTLSACLCIGSHPIKNDCNGRPFWQSAIAALLVKEERKRQTGRKDRQEAGKKCVNDKDRVPQKDKQPQRSPIMALHC